MSQNSENKPKAYKQKDSDFGQKEEQELQAA